jgi:hypothetical protein
MNRVIGVRRPTTPGKARSPPVTICHGVSTIGLIARKNERASRPRASWSRSVVASTAETDMPWPYIGLKLHTASPMTRNPAGNRRSNS